MRQLIATLLLMLVCMGAHAQPNWSLKKDEDGIKVFTSTTDNSSIKAIKVECTMAATPSQLVAYLLDIDKQPEWVYNTKSSTLLTKVKDNELIFYSVTEVPWPCTNRDYIAHFTINQVAPDHIVIDSKAEPDRLPRKDGIVRVKSSIAHWDITTTGPNTLNIVYTVQFDPGGAIPAWLINLFLTKGPYHTFEKLREGANKPAYQNAHVSFIK